MGYYTQKNPSFFQWYIDSETKLDERTRKIFKEYLSENCFKFHELRRLMAIQINENFETLFQSGLNEGYNIFYSISIFTFRIYNCKSVNELMNIKNPFEIFIKGFEGKILDFISNNQGIYFFTLKIS